MLEERAMLPAIAIDERVDDATATLLDLTPDPLWIVDAAGNVTTFNSAFERWWNALTGASARPGMRFDAPDDTSLRDVFTRVLGGRTVLADFRVVIWGTERTFTLQAQPMTSAGANHGAIRGAAFIAREITHQTTQPHEAALELALVHLFSGDETLPAAIAKTLEFLCASESWDAGVVWLIEGDELRPFAMQFNSPDLNERLSSRVAELRFTKGHGVPGRTWASGDVVWIADIFDESTMQRAELFALGGLHSVVGAPITDAGRIVGILEFFTRAVRPVSERTKRGLMRTGSVIGRLIERRRLLELVQRKGAEWVATFDSIDAPIFLLNTDGAVLRVNHAAHLLAGENYDDIIGRPLRSLGDGEPWITLADTATAVRDSGIACTAQITAGETTWEAAASILSGEEEKRIVIFLRDLTQLLKLQESVRRGEQLAALGELVAGVAHEVKNPIFGMKMTLELLDQHLKSETADTTELLGALHKWLERLDNLTENLLEYGRTWTVNLEPGDVREVVRQAIDTYAPRALNNEITIELRDDEKPATILMDAKRLVHAFENLIANALQFSQHGATVTIDTNVTDDAMIYSVRDRGPGFRKEDLSRVFQPFFTRRRGGTGLGLSIVQRIVEEHGGNVSAENHSEGGALLRVQLPLFTDPSPRLRGEGGRRPDEGAPQAGRRSSDR